MHFCLLIFSLLSSIALGLEGGGGKHWAVLVAGSRGWDNYRHQADVCHAYHVLRKNGFPRENIITMMYDDVAYHRRNPFPGKLFNDYQHKDVYEGVKIDYRGTEVTPAMFLRVLKGDQELKESGFKVVDSGPQDNVFIFFTDHGAPNLIVFPDGELYASELNKTLADRNRAMRYRNMVLYIEACHSGSMFERILPENVQIFAATAADPTESSWATFCADFSIDTCLADDFSYQWMTDTEKHRDHLSNWSVLEQIFAVTLAVKGSHVMYYGDSKVALQSVAEFQANGTRGTFNGFTGDRSVATRDRSTASHAHLIPLMHQMKKANSPKEMELAQKRFNRALELGKMARETMDEIVEEVTSTSAPSGKSTNVHERLDCYQKAYGQYKIKCFSIQQVPEVAKYLEKLDHLCEQGYDASVITQAIFTACE
ncbi:Legumain-protease-precursor [Fasciola hepatica]|uniref:Hemoglobinase n=2 Tax=Fasciola hepatica TaxID=6192 RepID=A0A4E0RRX8_FASHE|nr:Legumain-protease-precursor [Fasciola hepatica]